MRRFPFGLAGGAVVVWTLYGDAIVDQTLREVWSLAPAKSTRSPPIPLKLLQFGDKRNESNMRLWTDQTDGLEYVFMDAKAASIYLRQAWGERHAAAFDLLPGTAARGSFLRLCYLADQGGYWADMDICPGNVPLDVFANRPDTTALVSRVAGPRLERVVWGGFLGAVPQRPELLRLARLAPGRWAKTAGAGSRAEVEAEERGVAGPGLLKALTGVPGALVLYPIPERSWKHEDKNAGLASASEAWWLTKAGPRLVATACGGEAVGGAAPTRQDHAHRNSPSSPSLSPCNVPIVCEHMGAGRCPSKFNDRFWLCYNDDGTGLGENCFVQTLRLRSDGESLQIQPEALPKLNCRVEAHTGETDELLASAIGLAGKKQDVESPSEAMLDAARRLFHSRASAVYVSLEGWEWNLLLSMAHSDTLRHVRQLVVRVHFWDALKHCPIKQQQQQQQPLQPPDPSHRRRRLGISAQRDQQEVALEKARQALRQPSQAGVAQSGAPGKPRRAGLSLSTAGGRARVLSDQAGPPPTAPPWGGRRRPTSASAPAPAPASAPRADGCYSSPFPQRARAYARLFAELGKAGLRLARAQRTNEDVKVSVDSLSLNVRTFLNKSLGEATTMHCCYDLVFVRPEDR